MATLYLETNFLVGIATGRVPDYGTLLTRAGSDINLAIPDVCFFECYSWMEGEGKRRREFSRSLQAQIAQSERDVTSPYARSLVSYLRESVSTSDRMLVITSARLSNAVRDVLRVAESIGLTPTLLERSLTGPIIGEMTDDLILHCILDHARERPAERKALLSGNTRDFNGDDARAAFRSSGVHFVSEVSQALGWLEAGLTL